MVRGKNAAIEVHVQRIAVCEKRLEALASRY
jgi:hypothetical protein